MKISKFRALIYGILIQIAMNIPSIIGSVIIEEHYQNKNAQEASFVLLENGTTAIEFGQQRVIVEGVTMITPTQSAYFQEVTEPDPPPQQYSTSQIMGQEVIIP